MSEEKKGFWSKLFGPKKSSCCSIKIEKEPEDAAAEGEAMSKEKAEADSSIKQPDPAPCCGLPKKPMRQGGGNCCG